MNEQPTPLEQFEQQIQASQIQTDAANLNRTQQEMMLQDNEKGMIAEQLDVGELLDKIHNLLKGYVLQREHGKTTWVKPTSNDQVILSDYGINYIMSTVQWYLNKNTLLSNYSEDQINAKMEDLSITMADAVFMEYDKMFLYPTLNDCKNEIEARINNRKEIKMFALKLLGKEGDEKEIEKEVIKNIEDRIEKEMEVIRQQKIKNKLKRFESILRVVQDTIHSAYQRAWKGQERTTLRQHTHISETKGGMILPPQNTSMNPFAALKRR